MLASLRERVRLRTDLFLLVICVPLALALVSPIFHLLIRASEVEAIRALEYLLRPGTLRIMGRSLLLMLAVSLTSCLIGIPLAWLTVRTNLRGRGFWTVILTLPLVFPSYVGAFALIGALGPRGFVQGWLEPLGVERLPSIYGFWGAWLSVTIFSYPYVFLSVRAGLRGIDPALEEASRMLGKSAWVTFWRVTLPQLRPFIMAGALLVALYTLADFGAVALMQYDTFTRAIYFQRNIDRGLAALLSLVLVVFTLIFLTFAGLMEGRGHYFTRSTRRQPRRIRLGRWQFLAQMFCAAVVLIALIAPLGVITYWLINGLQNGETFRDVLAPLQRSLRVSALAALACGLIALPFVFLQVRYPSWLSRVLARSAYLGYALPGVVIALALVFFGANVLMPLDFLGLDNYRVLPLLIFAYVVRFMPQALGPARAGLMQVNPNQEESGLMLGRSRPFVFASVTLPLMRSGLIAGMALVFLTTMKELPTTLLLAPVEYDTLVVRIWSATSEAFYARAALPALILVGLSALSLVFILEAEES